MQDTRTLFIRTDVENREYQDAVKDILFQNIGNEKIKRLVYYQKEDQGKKLQKLTKIALQHNIDEPWKALEKEESNALLCSPFRRRYSSLEINYGNIPRNIN